MKISDFIEKFSKIKPDLYKTQNRNRVFKIWINRKLEIPVNKTTVRMIHLEHLND